jgi:pimeloyl-ACP methyl ester carboxylesterase
MEKRRIRLAAGEIPYLEGGSGPSLLFLHGIFATADAYLPLLKLFAASYHVIAPTHPGHGEAFSVPKDWKLVDFTRFYQDLLLELSFTPDILVGHSFGGTIALLLAHENIGKQAIIMDAPGLPFVFDLSAYTGAILTETKAVVEAHPDTKKLLDMTLAAGTLVDTAVHHPDAVSTFAAKGSKFNIRPELRGITIPVSLFWGALDHVVPPDVGNMMKHVIPGSELTVFPERGHNYPVTDPGFTYGEIMKIISNKQ